MTPGDSLKFELAQQIAFHNAQTAKALARRMSPDSVGSVLEEAGSHGRVSVRLLVLDIAAEVPSAGASRAILGRLGDTNLSVRAVANSLIVCCTQKTIVPDLFATLNQDLDSPVKGAVVRQIGTVGSANDIPGLRAFYKKVVDPKLRDHFTAALARLGDPLLSHAR